MAGGGGSGTLERHGVREAAVGLAGRSKPGALGPERNGSCWGTGWDRVLPAVRHAQVWCSCLFRSLGEFAQRSIEQRPEQATGGCWRGLQAEDSK